MKQNRNSDLIVELLSSQDFIRDYTMQFTLSEEKAVAIVAPKNNTPHDGVTRNGKYDRIEDMAFSMFDVLPLGNINLNYPQHEVHTKYKDITKVFPHDFEYEDYKIVAPKFQKAKAYGIDNIIPGQIFNDEQHVLFVEHEDLAKNLTTFYDELCNVHESYGYGKISLHAYAKLFQLPELAAISGYKLPFGQQLYLENKNLLQKKSVDKYPKQYLTIRLEKEYTQHTNRLLDMVRNNDTISWIDKIKKEENID